MEDKKANPQVSTQFEAAELAVGSAEAIKLISNAFEA